MRRKEGAEEMGSHGIAGEREREQLHQSTIIIWLFVASDPDFPGTRNSDLLCVCERKRERERLSPSASCYALLSFLFFPLSFSVLSSLSSAASCCRGRDVFSFFLLLESFFSKGTLLSPHDDDVSEERVRRAIEEE